MSIGNLKDTGNQGNNLPYQWKVLQGLQAIFDGVSQPLTCVDEVTVCGTTFTDILGVNALNVNVVNPIPLEVIINEANDSILVYGNDGTTNRKIKTDVNGELQVDVLTMPATFAEDTAHVSGNIGSFILGVRNDLNSVMTSADGEYSPIAVNNKGAVAIQDGGNSITVDGTVAATQSGTWNITNITGTVSLPTGAATETTLAAVNTKLTSTVRTPTFLRPSGVSGSTLAAYSVSFASVGTADAIVGTIVLKPGETLNFDAGALNNTLAPIAYDTLTSGAELIIITLI